MSARIHGIHHVTAIGGPPAVNVDFYTRVLGLRLVKRTVNFDDPTTWHLYFGDRLGSPGTIMTFFPHPLARPGRAGGGEVGRTTFAVPTGTLDPWQARLAAEGWAVEETAAASPRVLELRDPDGVRLALVESTGASGGDPWAVEGVPPEIAIRGFESVRLDVPDVDPTADFLREVFGLPEVERQGGRRCFDAGDGQRVEVAATASPRAQLGAGSVHHVAFRVPDDDAQLAMQRRLAEGGFAVTDVQDRQYFRSIYFREPGGVIFEIATDVPGFAVDEAEAELGQALKLPPWLESRRSDLEQALPPLTRED